MQKDSWMWAGLNQASRAEVRLAPLFSRRDRNSKVIDAAAKFLEQGGRWTPSRTIARAIEDAVLDRQKCPRI
jgi:hypothetical protein